MSYFHVCRYLVKVNSAAKKHRFYVRFYHKIAQNSHTAKMPSKTIRKLFLDFFMNEKSHTYVHSSPIFLKNDPTLLFVNAGMNQFRSLLANKISPDHRFSNLRRATNSQKCIRLSGKHNDLDDVGRDLHHHTFFEMLGNWSFSDYSKRDACEMAWELLTKVYNLNPNNLYLTYFGGCTELNMAADEECLNIWLDIGVMPDHIFPFGAKDNFWAMGDVGPCGPCTEIHYDFLGSGPVTAAQRINADKPDLIEIWNLVFIQYNKEQNGILSSLPSLSVDTGMGFERLTAVLQGTMSNYDTDIFFPIFKAIEKNFNVRPYEGRTGSSDADGLDSAYRIIADHSRMFSVAIADGLFPDNYDAGHVLRKIIRRASYAANKIMKTHPGVLSTLVPVVAESLDFFPEVSKSVNEIIETINEEEKLFHHLVNRGRKARNKMMTENNSNILNGLQVWKLKENFGLEENVIIDLASEIHLKLDWAGYETVCEQKRDNERKHFEDKLSAFSTIAKILQENNVLPTNDSFKYNYSTAANNYGVREIEAVVVGVITDNQLVQKVSAGNKCLIVTDKSNFYSEAGGQVADIGKIFSEDFTFEVAQVISSNGYIFHSGTLLSGEVQNDSTAKLHVDKVHRLGCCQNHTATHLLSLALRRLLPNTCQRSSYVGPSHLKFGFSAKATLTIAQIEEIENAVNEIIKKNIRINETEVPFEKLLANYEAVILRGEEYPNVVKVIAIGNIQESNQISSIEPCCGTHVRNTSDIGKFIIIPSKSHGGCTKYLSAVTGNQAIKIEETSRQMHDKVLKLEERVINMSQVSKESLSNLLKEVKRALKDCQQTQHASLVTLEKCEKILQDLKLKLTDMLASYSSSENLIPVASEKEELAKPKVSSNLIQLLQNQNIAITDDSFKYEWNREGPIPIEAKILAIVVDDNLVSSVKRGFNCQLVIDKTNFYSEDDDQASDAGIISCEDFVFKVSNVYKVDGFVFHDGYVEDGCIRSDCIVKSVIDREHRLACSQNHSALHLLNAALREELPYAYQQSALAGPKELCLTFSSKCSLTESQVESIESKVNEAIKLNLKVLRNEVPKESLDDFPTYKLPTINKAKDLVPNISIAGEEESVLKSSEPCYGTHVNSTSEIGKFIITSSKSKSNREKVIRAVTGFQAEIVKNEGDVYDKQVQKLQKYVLSCLSKDKPDFMELWDCLKELKEAKAYHETDLPLILFRKNQSILLDLSSTLTDVTKEFVQKGFKDVSTEMKMVLKENSNNSYIVHKLQAVGDGKKVINYALENSDNKPAMYFAQDGYKNIICSCQVPKHLVSPTFSALLWINPVASLLEGRARSLTKDPELLYSVVCEGTVNLDKAMNIAKQFIEEHLVSSD